MTGFQQQVRRHYLARQLTAKAKEVLMVLGGYADRFGRAWPSYATLAERAGCHEKTARRALQAARALGLVSWRPRTVRAAWRALRTSNAYTLAGYAAPPTDGHFARRMPGQEESKLGIERSAARAALAVIARQREATLFGRGRRDIEGGGQFAGRPGP